MRMLGFVLAGGLAITMSAASAQQDNGPPAPEADQAEAQAPADTLPILYGEKAFGGWEEAQPGQERLIRPSDLPAPMATDSASNPPATAARQDGDVPVAPANFSVNLFAEGLEEPRTIHVAPDGTIFVVESRAGRISTFRLGDDGKAVDRAVFAEGLRAPYGLAFYPVDRPEWIYVGEINRVVRFPYVPGKPNSPADPEVIIPDLPTGGHWTRDIVFSPDSRKLFIAVGSASNVAGNLPEMPADQRAAFEADRLPGAAWGEETNRADVLEANPDGSGLTVYAAGLRNCSGLAMEATTGSPWCAVNERDGLGDNLPPDYVTRVLKGGFYGWPWYYIGSNEDPRHAGERPDLRDHVVTPDVLIQAHSAPLGLTFYDSDGFPEEYRGDLFVALHGSWNRGKRTGYKVVRVMMEAGQPNGVYQDFLTGFVRSDAEVWGRPVGVAVAPDGSLLVSEDGNGTIWRVSRSADAPN